VDLNDRVLYVWNSKFYKSRLVPFGVTLCQALVNYRKEREYLPFPDGDRSSFFANRFGKTISHKRLQEAFVRLRKRAGVGRPDSNRWQPRIYDLRATFAVHRLIAWYRERVNVQARLQLLATYLGHKSVSGTQVYLTMTPELLGEASQLFELYSSPEKDFGNE
jgi:integrase